MSDGDVFAKLSRILETHAFTTDDKAIDRLINDYINDDTTTPFPESQEASFDGCELFNAHVSILSNKHMMSVAFMEV